MSVFDLMVSKQTFFSCNYFLHNALSDVVELAGGSTAM